MEQPDTHIFVRASAMCALTLLADPVPPSASFEEHERHQDYLNHLLPFLQAFLPTPDGVVPTLKTLCIDVLTDQDTEANVRPSLSSLPEELRVVVERKKTMPKKGTPRFNLLQIYAALGISRIILKKLGIRMGAVMSVNRWCHRALEKIEKKQRNEATRRLELLSALEGEPLATWLPHIKQVLIDSLCNSTAFIEEDALNEEEGGVFAETSYANDPETPVLPFYQKTLVLTFLKRSGLFEDTEAVVRTLMRRLSALNGEYPSTSPHCVLT